jgi:hypothetical protein
MRNAYKILVEVTQRKRSLVRPMLEWEDVTELDSWRKVVQSFGVD